MASVSLALGDQINRLYVQKRNTPMNSHTYFEIDRRLNALVERWNTRDGRRCSCGVILQIMSSGTLINCEWSRSILKLPPLKH